MMTAEARYRITRLDPAPRDPPAPFAAWAEPIGGDMLATIGLPSPPLGAEACAIVSLTPVQDACS